MSTNQKVSTALGASISRDQKVKFGKPSVIFSSQPYGYIPLEKPEELKQWEADLKTYHGISLDASNLAGIACETCSGGCSDMCDQI